MKKILSLCLVLVLSLCMLAGCDDPVIGEYDYPDYVPNIVNEIDLNLYIIGGNPDGKAITTVKREITAYTSAKFKVNLDVKYFTEAEYNAAVSADLSNSATSVDIVLINNETMFNELVGTDRLVNLDSFIASKEFGTLNASIASPLLDAAMYEKDGVSSLYCIPNNRVLGTYRYLKIDRAEGHIQGYSTSELDNMTVEEAEVLKQKIIDDGKNPDDYITIVENAMYEAKAALETEGYACVILDRPTVTSADAYSSAFAITTDCSEENYARAMEIIYAINTDVYLHNLLAFGVKNTNYYLDDDNFVTFADGDSAYVMDLKYTGDLFISYFVDGVYTPDVKFNGEKQNLDASFVAPVVTPSEENEDPEQ